MLRKGVKEGSVSDETLNKTSTSLATKPELLGPDSVLIYLKAPHLFHYNISHCQSKLDPVVIMDGQKRCF